MNTPRISRTTASSPRPPRGKRPDAALLFFAAALALFLCAGIAVAYSYFSEPETPVAQITESVTGSSSAIPITVASSERCQALIASALQASDQGCTRMGVNQACYGNQTVSAQLAPNAPGRFAERGDVINVDSLLSLNASPLDPDTDDWGIAVFKLTANVPGTLPGENVTFIVFGNTTLANSSGDMRAFYFTSRLGQIACEAVPFDGILLNMSEGAGYSFSANGANITLMGSASLNARSNERMTVGILRGSASITSHNQTQFFGAGQEVQIPLTGLDPSGPPSAPESLNIDSLAVSCTLLGSNCNPGELVAVDPTQAFLTIAQAGATVTSGPSPTPSNSPPPGASPTPTDTATLGPSPTPSNTPPPGASPTSSNTPPPGASPTSANIASATSVAVSPTLPPTSTNTVPPSATQTPLPTDTPTATNTPLPTDTPAPQGCALTSTAISFPGAQELAVTIQNNGAAGTISDIFIAWPETPPAQQLRVIRFAGSVIWDSVDNNSPSSLPAERAWAGGDRSLPSSSVKELRFEFHKELAASGFSLTVTFDNGCSVSAS
jgi:hypothetical protein